jgi:hypothetical protein
MKPLPNSPDPLEQAVHRALRQLPERTAPAALEQRVLAEIARRVALPWWRKSFAYWPTVAKIVFLTACVAVVPLAWFASNLISAGLDSADWRSTLPNAAAWLHATTTVLQALAIPLETILHSIPALWLYGALAVFAAVYAALFGLGAAAYKAVRAHA